MEPDLEGWPGSPSAPVFLAMGQPPWKEPVITCADWLVGIVCRASVNVTGPGLGRAMCTWGCMVLPPSVLLPCSRGCQPAREHGAAWHTHGRSLSWVSKATPLQWCIVCVPQSIPVLREVWWEVRAVCSWSVPTLRPPA